MRKNKSLTPWQHLLGITLLVVACGGTEEDSNGNSVPDQCGPNGHAHTVSGGGTHCDCNDGYYDLSGTCVPERLPPASTTMDPDCGDYGTFNGRTCECIMGYTQIGTQENRSCVEIPLCQGLDDSFEPNNDPDRASSVLPSSESLYACPADPDWFVFEVTSGDTVRAEVRFSGASVDLDLFLYGPSSRSPRAFSVGDTGNSETAMFTARADGTAGILVSPYGIGEGEYQITVTVEDGEPSMCSPPGAVCRVADDCCSGYCHLQHCH